MTFPGSLCTFGGDHRWHLYEESPWVEDEEHETEDRVGIFGRGKVAHARPVVRGYFRRWYCEKCVRVEFQYVRADVDEEMAEAKSDAGYIPTPRNPGMASL